MGVSEIRVKQIRVNQGLGVHISKISKKMLKPLGYGLTCSLYNYLIGTSKLCTPSPWLTRISLTGIFKKFPFLT